MYEDRIRRASLRAKVTTADHAASWIKDGMVVGMSGFTRAGDCKVVPIALAERAELEPVRITLVTGASLGHGTDRILAEAGVTARRLPFQVDTTLRQSINEGGVMFMDQHLSETAARLRAGQHGRLDVALIEAAAIAEDGSIVPTTSVGNSATFAALADTVIIELNLSMPTELEGLHDIYLPGDRPGRAPIPLTRVDQRIGGTRIAVDPAKIAAIVITNKADSFSTVGEPTASTRAIGAHLEAFFADEVRGSRMPSSLLPLQAGIGNIANSVLNSLAQSRFENLTMYSEVLQDSTIDLIDSGKLEFASASSMTLSARHYQRVLDHIAQYRSKLVLRPQEISNHPELIGRLGVIAINTALECDIYGNVNSTHVGGTRMMNGIGGSGDFARHASVSIFVTESIAKGGDISSIVPMVTHVDHTEHDVDVIVTEHGLADLRGLAPRERALRVIHECAHPLYRDVLLDYFKHASMRGGQTPHLLEHAFALHARHRETGSMLAQHATVE